MSWWEDGSYPIWTSCEAVGTLSQWPLLSVRDTTSVSLHFSVIQWLHCREINPFWISWLKLLSTVRWGLSSMNICKLDIFSWRLLSVSQSNWLASSWYEPGGNLGNSHLVLTICYVSINTFWFLYLITLWSAFHLSSTWRNLNLICTLSVHISSRDIFVQCSNLSSDTSVLAEDSAARIFEQNLLTSKLLNFMRTLNFLLSLEFDAVVKRVELISKGKLCHHSMTGRLQQRPPDHLA